MMTVYTVIGGVDYEGCDADSLRVFMTRESAEAYAATLTAPETRRGRPVYDFTEIMEQVVA